MEGKVYWDSRNKVYSVKDKFTGRVVLKARSLCVRNATFTVSKAGVDRIRRTNKKTVVATINGTICVPTNLNIATSGRKVRFNPYEMDEFRITNCLVDSCMINSEPIHSADLVHLTPKGVFV